MTYEGKKDISFGLAIFGDAMKLKELLEKHPKVACLEKIMRKFSSFFRIAYGRNKNFHKL